MGNADPFQTLGLPARAGLTDDDVRAAWRRIAAATHPDRDDGGSPERYAAAAAAYATLRTSFGRGEALADLAEKPPAPRPRPGSLPRRLRAGLRAPWRVPAPWRLPARAGAAAAVTGFAFWAAGWSPGTAGVLAGAVTWLVLGLRRARS